MSKRFRGILAAVLAVAVAGVLAWPAVMAAQGLKTGGSYYYFFQVQNEYGEPFTEDGFANCSIYTTRANGGNITAVTHSAASLAQGTGVAGPLYSSVNGLVHWYSAYNGPVDVVCYTKGGDSGRKAQMRIDQHQLKIDTSGTSKVVRFPFVGSATTPTSTGLYIPAGAMVTNVGFQIDTVGATAAHINVSFGGNHAVSSWNALANRVAISANDGPTPVQGFRMLRMPSGNAGSAGGALHLGLALRHVGVAPDGVYNGGYMVHVTGGLELTYNTASIAPAGGHVFVFYRLLHVGGAVGY